jgi:hypothetical protein
VHKPGRKVKKAGRSAVPKYGVSLWAEYELYFEKLLEEAGLKATVRVLNGMAMYPPSKEDTVLVGLGPQTLITKTWVEGFKGDPLKEVVGWLESVIKDLAHLGPGDMPR